MRIDEVLKVHVRGEEERARRPGAEAPERSEGAKARVAEEREPWRGESE